MHIIYLGKQTRIYVLTPLDQLLRIYHTNVYSTYSTVSTFIHSERYVFVHRCQPAYQKVDTVCVNMYTVYMMFTLSMLYVYVIFTQYMYLHDLYYTYTNECLMNLTELGVIRIDESLSGGGVWCGVYAIYVHTSVYFLFLSSK